jgi:hypothetical protein
MFAAGISIEFLAEIVAGEIEGVRAGRGECS